MGIKERKKEINCPYNKLKKKETIDELKETLQKEHNFYSRIGTIRLLIRSTVFTVTTLSLYLFDIINLDEMVFVFLALVLVEYLRYKKSKSS